MAGGVAIQAAVSRPDVANHITIGWSGSQAPFPTAIQWASFAAPVMMVRREHTQ